METELTLITFIGLLDKQDKIVSVQSSIFFANDCFVYQAIGAVIKIFPLCSVSLSMLLSKANPPKALFSAR